MAVSGGYVLLPEEIEILRELETISNKEILNSQFLQIIKHLKSNYAHVRAKCLRVIVECLEPNSQVPYGRSTVFDLLQFYSNENDARVRETVLWAHVQWLEKGITLPDLNVLCDMVEYGFNDCENEVVMTALKLAVQLGKHRPEVLIGRVKSQIRLADKGFIIVACAMNHPSASVRKVAAQLLSALPNVSEHLLLTTLEKTVMVDRVIRKSAFDKTNEINKLFWIDDLSNFAQRPIDNTSAEDALAMGGINGTIISGLEDDLYEIRLETVISVGSLSLISRKFATACQDLLVDMLTDDIEVVRASAVTNLSLASGIKHNMTLRSDQLDIVLSVLEEKSGNMRRSIHLLLGNCRLASANALIRLLDGLKRNLLHYELDRDSIWKCSAHIGHNHPEFVQMKLSSLLNLHPYLMVKQCLRSDPEYITVLLMVINASRRLSSIKTNFPNHIKEHETYIEELLPELILDIHNDVQEPRAKQAKYDDDGEMECDGERVHDTRVSRQDLYACLLKTIGLLDRMLSGDSGQSYNTNVMRQLLQDLRQISKLCDETKGLCLWLRDLGQMARLSQQRPMTLSSLSEARYLAYKMMHAYTGITDDDCALLTVFIGSIDKKINCIQSQDFLPTRETKEVLSTCPAVVDLTRLSLIRSARATGATSGGLMQTVLCSVVQVSGKQLYPTMHDTEKSAVRFCAGMSVCVPVRAEVRGLDVCVASDGRSVTIKTPVVVVLERPDSLVIRWQPPDRCWTRMPDSDSLFLDTEVPVSCSEWSEPGLVHLGLAVYLADIDATWKLTSPVGVKLYPVAANRAL